MSKLNCTDGESGIYPNSLSSVLPGHIEGDTEVVMVMSLAMAKRVLDSQIRKEGDLWPTSQLLLRRAQANPGWRLELPRLEMRPDGSLRFEDGRHRVAHFCEMGNSVIPFLTYERVAKSHPNCWGSIALANSLYDFSACHPRPLIGSP